MVYLPEGTYRVDGLLSVTHSGTVIRGDGPSATRIGFTRHAAMSDINHLQFSGTLAAGPSVSLVLDAEQGETAVAVADAAGPAGDEVGAGMAIRTRSVKNMRWTLSHSSPRDSGEQYSSAPSCQSIESARPAVTLDAPLRHRSRFWTTRMSERNRVPSPIVASDLASRLLSTGTRLGPTIAVMPSGSAMPGLLMRH